MSREISAMRFSQDTKEIVQRGWHQGVAALPLAFPLLVVFADTDSMFSLSQQSLLAGTLLFVSSWGLGQLARILSPRAARFAVSTRHLISLEAIVVTIYPAPAVVIISLLCLSLRYWKNAQLCYAMSTRTHNTTRSRLLADLGFIHSGSIGKHSWDGTHSGWWATTMLATAWLQLTLANKWPPAQGRVPSSLAFLVASLGLIYFLMKDISPAPQAHSRGSQKPITLSSSGGREYLT